MAINFKTTAITAALITLPGVESPAGIVAHFPMEIASDGTISEALSGERFSVLGNFGAESVRGASGNAVFLDGYTSYIGAKIRRLAPMRRMTVSLWLALESYPIVKVDDPNPGAQTCIINCLDHTARTGFGFFIGFDGQYSFQTYVGGELAIVNVSAPLPLSRWNCLAAVVNVDEHTLVLYNNGKEMARGECSSGDIVVGEADLHIAQDGWEVWFGSGADAFRTTAFGGIIDELTVRDEALSPDQLLSWRADAPPVVTAPASRYTGDRWRPVFHGMPSTAWTNETHGLVWSDGLWHVFFQKNGLGPYMARLNWGHLTSTNLFDWHEEKVALTPGASYDMKGCWSGCVFSDPEITGGQQNILYTAVDYGRARIARAVPTDNSLLSWNKYNGNPLIDGRPAGLSDDFRDPYFFRHEGKAYIIVGSSRAGRGLVTLHRWVDGGWSGHENDDFYWAHSAEDDGVFIEMPSITVMPGGKALFCYTPIGTSKGTMALYRTGYINTDGRFVTDEASVHPRSLDLFGRDGFGFLSPSITQKDGRVLALGIVPDKISSADNKANGWAHCYSLPRQWSTDNAGNLFQTMPTELRDMRGSQSFSKNDFNLSGVQQLHSGRQFEVSAKAVCGNSPWGIRFLKNPANPDHSHASLTINPSAGTVTLNLQHLPKIVNDGGVYDGLYTATLPDVIAPGKELSVNLFFDHSIIDIFIGERYAASVRVFPHDEDGLGVEAFSEGDATAMRSLHAWALSSSSRTLSDTGTPLPTVSNSSRTAIIVNSHDPSALNPQEREALALFSRICPDGAILTPSDMSRLDYTNFGTVWVHSDCVDNGTPAIPYAGTDVSSALKRFMAQGGCIYLSKHAVRLLPEIGRLAHDMGPNIMSFANGGTGTDVWNIQPHIGYGFRESDNSQYYDHSSHPIYEGMATTNTDQGRTFPMEGSGDNTEIWREDHNCIWDLNALSYNADGKNTVERFERHNNATVIGTWGHVVDHAVAGIVELHPDAVSRASNSGTVIANGIAAYELAPRFGGNTYQGNVERLTANTLKYLESFDQYDSPTDIDEIPLQPDNNPTFYPVYPSGIRYSGLTPGSRITVTTPDGRTITTLTTESDSGYFSLPAQGPVIVTCGSNTAKLMLK